MWISDHYHPWLDSQGESPFVWCTIGAIAAKTGLRVTTGVTCPTYRIHPAIVAQAAATADDRDTGVEQAHRLWRNSGIPGVLSQDLPTPAHFEQAASLVTKEQTSDSVVAGPDPQPYLDAIGAYVEAGYDELYLAQIGPDQSGFLRYWEKELAPELGA